jgi:hypothetical protein|tara:strand:+ start:1520 stop:2038 length:519 start_codon:yes stop_codon:yes gene_type:complete
MKIITRKEAKEKGLKHYFTGKPCPHGHIAQRFISGGCTECHQILQTKNRENNREEYNDYFKKRYTTERRRASYIKYMETELLNKAKHRAKRKNQEFNLTIEDIVIPEKCPVFGESIVRDVNNQMSPSLDRVDNTKGYIKGNVQVISKKANMMKANLTISDLDKIYRYINTHK